MGDHQGQKGSSRIDTAPFTDSTRDNSDSSDYEFEPEIHARTYIAVASMFMLNFVQVIALQGSPAVLTYIARSLEHPEKQTWVPNAMALVQAVLGPVFCTMSDTLQARKMLMVGNAVISFIGAAIAPGAKDMYRLIAAQTLIGFGFATVPLAYCVSSEILPRKWRPVVQSGINIAAATAACIGPVVIGAFTKRDEENGWRNFYWFQMALWGVAAVGIFVGYQPPKRPTALDELSFWRKLGHMDLVGTALLTIGLTLVLVALNLGGVSAPWTGASVLSTLIIGAVTLVAFGIYEWKGTAVGILHHDLFRGGRERGITFLICISLILIEGIQLFTYILFYPMLTTMLFESDPLLLTVRLLTFWIACAVSTVAYGLASTKFRTIRSPLFVGFFIYTAGTAALATLQPADDKRAIIFAALAGLGFGAPLILIVTGVQLSTPHHLIATATAATTSARSVSAAIFVAIYSAVVNSRLETYIPRNIGEVAAQAGLSPSATGDFAQILTGATKGSPLDIKGVTPAVLSAGQNAVKHAYADGIRVVFIIAAPFGLLACVLCLFLGDMRKTMNYHVDAPVEKLEKKHNTDKGAA